jgi:DNA uptake protein ComE-like DNA-binding protein
MNRLHLSAITPVAALLLLAGSIVPVQAQVGRSQGLIDPNTASEKELLALPHLNAGLVKQIIDQRPFLSPTNLHTVLSKSLSKEQSTELYRKAFVPINLNQATRDEILLIPGVGARLAHEFEEYRPYQSLAQFRKEIGKYVDEKEVARLEQYVFVPIKLNSASDDDFLSIPGVGQRLLHEFKEYRPYKSLAQFRKEIGKYVDKKEIARLERYVALD